MAAEAPAPAAAPAADAAAKPDADAATSDAPAAAGADAGKKKAKKRWFPLESNPSVMAKYAKGLGWRTGSEAGTLGFTFVDVLSPDDWALAMVPSPRLGVIFSYPITPKSEEANKEQAAAIASGARANAVSEKVYYTKQTVGNACGTVAIVHTLGNAGKVGEHIAEGSWLAKFLARTAAMTPDERALALEEDQELDEAHGGAASEGQSAVSMGVDSHFVAIVEVDGGLYELDGRKATPIRHGDTTRETFLGDACDVIKREFMERDPESIRFTIVALAADIAES